MKSEVVTADISHTQIRTTNGYEYILLSEYEKLQKQNEKLKDIATRVSKQGCNPVNQYDCLACDATKLLKEIEESND